MLEEVDGTGIDAVHAQVGGDAVADLVPGAEIVGLVRQQVDEPGADDVVGGVDGLAAGERSGLDGGDGRPVDAHIGDRVEAALGVDDPSAANHQVVHVPIGRFGRRLGGQHPGRAAADALADLGLGSGAGRAAAAQPAQRRHVDGAVAEGNEQAPPIGRRGWVGRHSVAECRPAPGGPVLGTPRTTLGAGGVALRIDRGRGG